MRSAFSLSCRSIIAHCGTMARLKAIDARLQQLALAPQELGKGRNVWYCMGYALATGRAEAIALHDCDILTYDRSLLARLIYPGRASALWLRVLQGLLPAGVREQDQWQSVQAAGDADDSRAETDRW